MSSTAVPMTRDAEARAASVAPRPAQRRDRVALYRLMLAAVILAVWQEGSGRIFDPFWTSSPLAILGMLWKWTVSGLLARHLFVTLEETAIGFVLGTAAAMLLALLIGRSDAVRRTVDPFLAAIYGVPKVALAPLFIMWFGIGMTPKIVLAGVSVFFLVFFNTMSGIREVDRRLVDAMILMGGSRLDIQRKIVLPAALPWVFTGLKLGLPYGFVGAVAAEMMASNEGIGFLTQDSAGQFNTAGVFAALFALMMVTTLLNAGLAGLERRLFRWR